MFNFYFLNFDPRNRSNRATVHCLTNWVDGTRNSFH